MLHSSFLLQKATVQRNNMINLPNKPATAINCCEKISGQQNKQELFSQL